MNVIPQGVTSGMGRQVFDLVTSLINPDRVRNIVGAVAKPVRKLPLDVKDPTKSKEENLDKRDAGLIERILARITFLHIAGVIALLATFVKPLLHRLKVFGDTEQPNFLSKAADWVLNPIGGLAMLGLSEISYNNGWHLSDDKRLEYLGVLEKVVGTAKWKELNLDEHVAKGNLISVPDVYKSDPATRILLEVRCSPKHRRATCFEGVQGQGKTFAAYLCAHLRSQALIRQGVTSSQALQINTPKLMQVADEKVAQTMKHGQLLGERLSQLVSQDPTTYAFPLISSALEKGSSVISDDAEYQLNKLDAKGFKHIQDYADKFGGGYIITIPKALEEVLRSNQSLSDSDRKTLLQRIDSVSFPFEANRRCFNLLTPLLQTLIVADLKDFYKTGESESHYHECALREVQKDLWKDHINLFLLDGGEKFGRTEGIGKLLSEYFDDEKLNHIVTNYPMNARYIDATIFSLAILLDNRREQNITREDLDFLLTTVLECDTFKNYVRSIEGSQQVQSTKIVKNDPKIHIDRLYGIHGEAIRQTFSKEGIKISNLDELFVRALEHNLFEEHNLKTLCRKCGTEKLEVSYQGIDLNTLQYFATPSSFPGQGYYEINGRGTDILIAIDKSNNKAYKGFISYQEDSKGSFKLIEAGDINSISKWLSLS